ncbi:MAG TPA: exonuclease subunit SbcD [Acidimicrobiia bacterium]|nr:exonuclease subunit SbcD [Acidimicrobiia bacterium]
MRVLHTSDWHVGKLLRGASRIDEHRAVLGEIAEIAARERVDLVLVVGDLYETAAPPPEATAVVYDALLALRETGAHVVVVGGNHDQQSQLESVAPVFARLGITVLGLPAGPERAVVDVAGARIVMMPWVSQRWAIKTEQLMGASAAATAQYYAARVARLLAWLSEGFTTDTVNIVAAHCMVQGGTLGGGERDAQLIDEYAVPTAAFPAAANYVALGHLHRAQQMPGAAPIWYSGSPIQVDFGEERDVKQVLLVDIPSRGAAKVKPVALTRGAVLRTLRGTFAELEAAAPDAGDAFLRVFVREQPRAGLADDVRALLPNAVDVRVAPDVATETLGAVHPTPRAALPRDLFRQYLGETGHSADDRLVALFDELLDSETV